MRRKREKKWDVMRRRRRTEEDEKDEEEEEDGERHEGPRRYLAAGYEEPQKHMEKRYSIDSLSSGTTQTQRRRMMWPRRSASRGGNQGSISNAV